MGTALAGKAVLVVEDDDDNAELLASILALEGAEVRSAASATEVGEVLDATWRPDVMLLDISLPEMSGYELLGVLRTEARLERVPAIAVTARAFDRDKERAAAAGFAMHVTKPYDPADLILLVAKLTA
jgi:CheY-like chemotaxis protein